MKSLNDYIKILRGIANNLNLHGESVEMIVQMLSNALYISEVEHITYSQEASLERASLENSKIQHCVNQMYSVFRGNNPRVIINIKATKLFNFQLYDEIIKSNNFKVYYLGYFDKDKREIVNSPITIYPDTEIAIYGLIASNIYTSTWTISNENRFYKNHPESNLSSDLYLRNITQNSLVDTTRIYSDHIKNNVFFDLTLPGYGCRIYYPETYRSNSVNSEDNLDKLELNVFKYMKLSSVPESELKALKMNGSQLIKFEDSTLNSLSSKENYTGLIYYTETSRDSSVSIHHKANKSRYTGTYLATNSDLSYLLQEYFPNKIKPDGVSYVFETPKSTTIETVHKTYKSDTNTGPVLTYDKIKDQLSDSIKSQNQNYLPSGTLVFDYSSKYSGNGNVSYDIISSSSIIPVIDSGIISKPSIPNIKVSVLKNDGGNTTILETTEDLNNEGLKLIYKLPNSSFKVYSNSGEIIINLTATVNNQNLELYIVPSDFQLTTLLSTITNYFDKEIIPTIATSNLENKTYYGLNLKDDTLYIQTDYDGNFLTTNNTTEASFYFNGNKINNGDCVYSLIPVSNITAEIDSKTGVIKILGMSKDVDTARLTITAEYNGNQMTEILTVRKTISNVNESERNVKIYVYGDSDDNLPIEIITASPETRRAEIEIPENSYSQIIIKTSDETGTTISNPVFNYSYERLNNILDLNTEMVSSLHLYYIPQLSSNLLTKTEKEKFIQEHTSYFITHDIKILEGTEYKAIIDVNLELYNNATLDETILEILNDYSEKFNQDLGDIDHQTNLYSEIVSLITKLPDVKTVKSMNITYLDASGNEVEYKDISDELDTTYFRIDCNVFSVVSA